MKALSMKVMVVFLLFAFSATVFAQEIKTEKFLNKAKENYMRSLESKTHGVVESSIFVLLEMKEKYPDANYKTLIEKLNELAAEGTTPMIRYKAQLASLYFDFNNMFSDLKINDTDKQNPDSFFKKLSERLEQRPYVAVN